MTGLKYSLSLLLALGLAGWVSAKSCGGAACKSESGCGKCEAAKSECKGGVCAPGAVAVKAAAADKSAEVSVPTVTTESLATLLRSGTPVVVLDARSAKWDDGRRIPGAKVLTAAASEADIAAAVPDKGALVVTYCTNLKCPASLQLAKRLGELGYTNVLKYPDGIDAWEAAGQKVDRVAVTKQ